MRGASTSRLGVQVASTRQFTRQDSDRPTRRSAPEAAAERTIRLLEAVAPTPRSFDVRLWNGRVLAGDGARDGSLARDGAGDAPRPTLVLNDPHALGRALTPPLDLSAGEAYVVGEIDVEGDLETLLAAFDELLDSGRRTLLTTRLRALGDLTVLKRGAARADEGAAARLDGRTHSRERDACAIRHHYDLPVDFYRLWLDRHLTYSCGYFPTGEESLDEAQEAKLEHVCRKLRLRPGLRLLDIGCGWGSLLRWAARHHGTETVGVTLAKKQAAEANVRLAADGLAQRATAEVRHYRDLRGRFDRIASIGMSEHVGRAQLESYFRAAWERLTPGGSMLNHAISRGPLGTQPDPSVPDSFIQRYVFPDGEIVDLAETIRAAEAVGFEVRDVEDLREHYATTLRHWVVRLEAHWDEAVAIAGGARARVWRLFMAASAHQFARGRLAVHQVLLGRPDGDGRVHLPASRADLYT